MFFKNKRNNDEIVVEPKLLYIVLCYSR